MNHRLRGRIPDSSSRQRCISRLYRLCRNCPKVLDLLRKYIRTSQVDLKSHWKRQLGDRLVAFPQWFRNLDFVSSPRSFQGWSLTHSNAILPWQHSSSLAQLEGLWFPKKHHAKGPTMMNSHSVCKTWSKYRKSRLSSMHCKILTEWVSGTASPSHVCPEHAWE